jgi:hypothetical protein
MYTALAAGAATATRRGDEDPFFSQGSEEFAPRFGGDGQLGIVINFEFDLTTRDQLLARCQDKGNQSKDDPGKHGGSDYYQVHSINPLFRLLLH